MALRKKHELRNYDFCYGMACNYLDMKTGVLYHIQEYREKIDAGETPEGIRMTNAKQDKELGYIKDYVLRELMKDIEPDPRYMDETPEEHRKNW